MIWLFLLPITLIANIVINAESMSGNIEKKDLVLQKFELNSNSWQVKSNQAETLGKCIVLSGKVTILAKNNHYKYQGEKFQFCPETNDISSLAPVKITNNKLVINAKHITLNLKNNKTRLSGIKANYE